MTHTLIVEHHGFHPVFRLIRYGKIFIMAVFANDFPHTRPILSGEGLVHTELHHIEEGVQHRRVVCQTVVVVHSPYFCVVLVQDFDVIQAYQPRTSHRFPYLFVPMGFVVADFQRTIGEQVVQPFLFGHIQFDFSYIGSACKTGLCPGTILFPANCNQISEEVGEVVAVGDERFFRGHFQMKVLPDERSHIGLDLSCVLFASNHTDQKVIGVADVDNPPVFRIHWVAVRDRAQITVELPPFPN